MHKNALQIWQLYLLGLPPLLLYITLHNISENTCFWNSVGSCIVTMEKVLTNITGKMCLNRLICKEYQSKIQLYCNVHSVEQKSISLKFSKSRTGSDVRYRWHHNSSLLLSPYLRIRGISLSSTHYTQAHCIYINRRQQYICLIWN